MFIEEEEIVNKLQAQIFLVNIQLTSLHNLLYHYRSISKFNCNVKSTERGPLFSKNLLVTAVLIFFLRSGKIIFRLFAGTIHCHREENVVLHVEFREYKAETKKTQEMRHSKKSEKISEVLYTGISGGPNHCFHFP